jgi:hypothetical protein
MGKLIIAAVFSIALAGCQSLGGGSFCRVMTDADGKPLLRPTVEDNVNVSDQLAAGLVVVLETGEKLKCWKAPKGEK